MIDIGVSYQYLLFDIAKIRNNAIENIKHLILIAGISAVDK